MELYYERCRTYGKRNADWKFNADVILLFRPGIIKPLKGYRNENNYDMFKNYFKTAFRNLANSKFYSGLNLTGLTLGLTVGLLILLWVSEELSYDRFHQKSDRIYRMSVNLESSGKKFAVQVVQPTIAHYGLAEVPAIQQAVRVSDCYDFTVFRFNDVVLKDNIAMYADPSFFTVFDYPLLKGNKNNPFPVTESVILTEKASKRFFGDADPVGKILVADNKDNFVVSGLLKDFPENSSLKCDLVFSTSLVKKLQKERGEGSFDEDSWGNYGWVTFLELQPGASIKAVEDQLTKINVSHQPNLRPIDVGYYTLQPLKDIHLYNADGAPAGLQTVKIFSIVALLILLIASINYVNLSTARAMLRFKEVSVRKIVGATRSQLFLQFIVQTFVFFFIALVFAMTFISLTMPLYNEIAGKNMRFDLFDPMMWRVIGGTLLFTLVISSIYPALLLSSFHPINALKAKLSFGIGNTAFRKILVVCQFAFSVGLIIATLMIGKQLSYVLEKELGYDKSYVISLNMQKMEGHYEKVKSELLAHQSVSGVTSATSNIINVPGSTLDVEWDGKNPDATFFFHKAGIDKDFIPLFKMDLVEGNNFTGAKADSIHYILNETAVRESGIKDPIGKKFRLHRVTGTIVGVVKDFHFVSLKQKIQPFVFFYQPVSSKLFVKTNGRDLPETIVKLEKIWKEYNEGFPFDYSFLDERYKSHYQAEQRTGKLFAAFTGVAMIISCLGLLGLATYTAERKVKEIGIRKVLGASVSSITYLLSRDFLVLIGISIAIAVPLTLMLMQRWMQGFAYRATLQWWVVLLAGLSTIFIAFLAISLQTIRSARENPVKSLRSE
ncbi:ABC transporter permease [Cytophagales bacterium WSM2-2]|nr:ABC transporter permease [Cytophagales bacterium WSM2-2]